MKILIIDDDQPIREALSTLLTRNGYECHSARNGTEGLEDIQRFQPDIILSDIMMPEMDGFDMLVKVKSMDPDIPVILMTGYSSIEGAIKAIKHGADEYLTKPLDHLEVIHVIEKAAEKQLLYKQNLMLKQRLSHQSSLHELVGVSKGLKKVRSEISQSAGSDISVLILGESGVGKELVAEAIHKHSLRKDEDFVAINCAAIPTELLESELFGHEKGAFSGAVNRKYGLFEMANKGTLFLDEIGEMSLALQSKMLRAIESHKIRRIGSTREISSDFRLICSTNRDLEKAMLDGDFRTDLYYRISPFVIEVPALRTRPDDIRPLIMHFLKMENHGHYQVGDEFLQALYAYHWPGNVRELKNVIDRAVLLANQQNLDVSSLGSQIVQSEVGEVIDSSQAKALSLAELERKHILSTLHQYSNNKTKAAESLGISLKTLYNKLNQYTSG